MQRKILALIILSALVLIPLFGGTTGKMAGRVTDQDGNPIPFAFVFFEGLEIGTQTKANGQFVIINIPPGIYTVQCSRGGFHPHTLTGVKINVDETKILDVELTSVAFKIDGMIISETKVDMIQKDNTGSGSTIDSETIGDIAVDDIEDILALAPGVLRVGGDLHVRGGRGNEVVYSIDGLSVSDPVDGGAALTIDTDAIQDMKTMTGGFTAEYGNAQSGIVNIITKDGSSEYSGKIELVSDHLLGDPDGFYNSNSDVIKFALGGPVLGPFAKSLQDKFTFFFNGAANWHDSRYKDYYDSNPNEELSNDGDNWLISEYTPYQPYEGRDDFIGFDLGQDRNYNLYNANLKMKYKFNPRQNFTFAVRGNQNHWYPYAHNWKYALEHYAEVENEQRQYIATYDHLFSPQMNLNVKASYYKKNSYQGPRGISRDDYFVQIDAPSWEHPLGFDPYYENLQGINTSGMYMLTDNGFIGEGAEYDWSYYSLGNPNGLANEFGSPGAIYRFNIDDKTESYTLRSDFEYQLNQIHGFKTGFEFIQHHIVKDQVSDPWDIDPLRYFEYLSNVDPFQHVNEGDPIIDMQEGSDTYGDTLEIAFEDMDFYSQEDLFAAITTATGQRDGYEADPLQVSYYLQDKMEWEGMIVNAGLRFDYWNLGNKYKVLRNAGEFEEVEFEDDEKQQLMISPRLGVSHPISETTVLHFAYNYQNQLPQMQYIFTSVTPQDALISNQNITIGNFNLEPQITVTYEVGLQKQFGEDYVVDVQAYFKNIYNYVSTVKYYLQDDGTLVPWYDIEPGSNVDVTTDLYGYISENYGSARGIDFNLQKMLSNFISGSFSYSLGWADGNDSTVNATQNEDTKIREFPLDWDIRHSASLNMTFKIARDEEYFLPFTDVKFPLDDFTVNFLYQISSGRPYTVTTEDDTVLDTNQERMNYTETANLKLSKRINFSDNVSLKLYVDVDNLFNKRNVFSVYSRTGSPYYNGEDLTLQGTDYTPYRTEYIYNLSTANPANWDSGRKITFGMSFNW